MITSGYTLQNDHLSSSSTSSIRELFLTDPWQNLYRSISPFLFFEFLTTTSLFQKNDQGVFIQLTGPPPSVSSHLFPSLQSVNSSPSHSSSITFGLSSLLFRPGFSRHCGFPGQHLFSRLWKLNQLQLHREHQQQLQLSTTPSSTIATSTTAATAATAATECVFKQVKGRKVSVEIVRILLHEIFRDCYTSWGKQSIEEEIQRFQYKHNLSPSTTASTTLSFSRSFPLKTPSRFAKLEELLAKLLVNSQSLHYSGLLETMTPLPHVYFQSNKQWVQHQAQQKRRQWEEFETQESCWKGNDVVSCSMCSRFPYTDMSKNNNGLLPTERNSPSSSSSSSSSSSTTTTTSASTTKASSNPYLSETVSPNAVFLFLSHCLRRIIPHSLFGSKHNWRWFLRHVYRLVMADERDEISLRQVMQCMQLSTVRWIQPRGKPSAADNLFSERLFRCFVQFVFHSIVVGLYFIHSLIHLRIHSNDNSPLVPTTC